MKKTIFEEIGGTYIRQGDYLIPCLTLLDGEQMFVGVWGQRHKRYLKEHKRVVYITLLTSGRLNSYLADIEEQAQEHFERIVEQVKQAQGITRAAKSRKSDGMGKENEQYTNVCKGDCGERNCLFLDQSVFLVLN